MSRWATTLTNSSRYARRLYHSNIEAREALRSVGTINGDLHSIDMEEFRQRAFVPENPTLIRAAQTSSIDTPSHSPLLASQKWFAVKEDKKLQYLEPFGDTIVPYELITTKGRSLRNIGNKAEEDDNTQELLYILEHYLEHSDSTTFHRFNAPLSLFLKACNATTSPQLYIAQAQISDLPKQLQHDLPTPRLVKEAGKGDIYDANIWMGIPSTYTPLHKDPNPNLFVQLASKKRIRLFEPRVGSAIFHDVQRKIGQSSHVSLRGHEMMEGPERNVLEEAVWGEDVTRHGSEAVVGPGDALFIPKGYWHSIKSVGNDVTASVNWWFR